MKGVHIESGSIGPIKLKPLLKTVQVPPLVGMILFGCLARNFIDGAYMDHYPEILAGKVRSICLSLILLRGAMELEFAGKGLTVLLLSIGP